MARLIITVGGETRTLELTSEDAVNVGRDPSNQVAVPDEKQASRRHCQLMPLKREGVQMWELTDLGATNKTRVNGKPTDRKVLTSGDVIQVGKAEMRFEDAAEEDRLKAAGRQGVCYLEWVTGDHKGEKVWLDSPRATLGRRESNTIRLDDRMSSGHHAEITKDLNGYTIRDLGSTNGTLVNGEPTTEAALAHGARIRVGNSRFAFKDPSMKDIEVELSQFEDDEGWGMMGDIDLSKARGSYTGLLVGFVILLGAGAAGWWISQQAEKSRSGGPSADFNLVANGTFDDADEILWSSDAEDAQVAIDPKGGRAGAGLAIGHDGDEGAAPLTVDYAGDFEALAARPFRVQADIRKRSGTGAAALVATWHTGQGQGARRLTHTLVLGDGASGWTSVDAPVVKPAWADRMSLGVRLDPGVRVLLDDVRVTQVDDGAQLVKIRCPGGAYAAIDALGRLDVVDSIQSALVTGARPVAREADGTVLDRFAPTEAPRADGDGAVVVGEFERDGEPLAATIRWVPTQEGLSQSITCDGAAGVGLRANLVRSVVGDRINVLTGSVARTLPATAGQRIGSVSKALAGNPDAGADAGRLSLLTFVPTGGDAELVLADALDPALLTVTVWTTGSAGGGELITDYTIQSEKAQAALSEARTLLRDRPGEGIERLRALVKIFPFVKSVTLTAEELASKRETKALADIAALEQALEAFRIYRSGEAMTEMVSRRGDLAREFPPRADGTGALEQRVAELSAAIDSEQQDFYASFSGPELSRLEQLADLLKGIEGYKPMAAMFYRAIVRRFGHMANADTPFGRRVLQAEKNLDALLAEPGLREAVPPAPSIK